MKVHNFLVISFGLRFFCGTIFSWLNHTEDASQNACTGPIWELYARTKMEGTLNVEKASSEKPLFL